MEVNSNPHHFEPAGRLDIFFRAMMGCYVAALVSPLLIFSVADWLTVSSALLALGMFGIALIGSVTWGIARWGEPITWLNSSWIALFLPILGAVPIAAYREPFFRYIATSTVGFQETSAAAVIGFTGYFLAIAASCIGVVLVHMARNRLANATVGNNTVEMEWTAGYPREWAFKIRIGTSLILIVLFGVAWLLQNRPPTLSAIYIGLLVAVASAVLDVDQTYHVTPVGLTRTRKQWLYTTQRHFSWKSFDGFSVTDDAIVLHRPLPHLDVRWSRADIIENESAILEALEEHLDRRT